MTKGNRESIDDLLFKFLVQDVGEEKRLILVYEHSVRTDQIVNSKGSISKKTADIIKLFDLTKTIEFGEPVIETHLVSSKRDFRKSVTPADISESLSLIMGATSFVVSEMTQISDKMKDINNLISAIKLSSSTEKAETEQESATILLTNNTEPLARVVFETITGAEINLRETLTREDVNNIGRILMEIISSHAYDDLSDEDQIRKLRAEIEYKIVESLPSHLRAGDVNINIDGFLREMKKFRDNNDERTEQ